MATENLLMLLHQSLKTAFCGCGCLSVCLSMHACVHARVCLCVWVSGCVCVHVCVSFSVRVQFGQYSQSAWLTFDK